MILLDTWAWIEYFKGSEKGNKIKSIIENRQIYTSAISIAEISKWFCQNKEDIKIGIQQLKENSIIIDLEEPILIESGRQYVELRKIKKDIGLIDVIIYTTAILHDLNVITNDNDFKGLPKVDFI